MFDKIISRASGIVDKDSKKIEQGMKLDYSNYRPSVLFINGKYWGIHNIREKMNEYYLDSATIEKLVRGNKKPKELLK